MIVYGILGQLWKVTHNGPINYAHKLDGLEPFGNLFPVDIYYTACRHVFGESFTPERIQRNSDRFNTMYGGLQPQVTNVVFVYGRSRSIIGRTTDLNDDATAIVIAGATQGNAVGPVTPNDSPAVPAARDRIFELIRNSINAEAPISIFEWCCPKRRLFLKAHHS